MTLVDRVTHCDDGEDDVTDYVQRINGKGIGEGQGGISGVYQSRARWIRGGARERQFFG